MIKSIVIMGFVVKNTTKCGLLDLLCPHSCRGCGHLGSVLCECCKKYMLEQYVAICPICKKSFAKKSKNVDGAQNVHEMTEKVNNYAESGEKTADKAVEVVECGEEFWKDEKWGGKCPECEASFDGVFAFGWRAGALEKLVEEYKYQSVRAMGEELVGLYDMILPELGDESRERELAGEKGEGRGAAEKCEVVVVPLPTVGGHVRERGFDHTLTLAKKLAKKRGWKCEEVLTREVDTVQVGAKVAERKTQAEKAYGIRGKVDPKKVYLLLDDVWTTGATMEAAEKVLRGVGAKRVYAAVIAVSRPKGD